MVESGMVAAGYTLLSTVCTGWQPRDPVTHELQENLTAWPGGMKAFAEYVHGKGMQLQVYTDAGTHNCCGDSGGGAEPGSLGFEHIDMKTFASWGADAVGVDYCGGPKDVEVHSFPQGFIIQDPSYLVPYYYSDVSPCMRTHHRANDALAALQGAYRVFADAVVQSGRDMQLEMWNLGAGSAYRWAPAMSRNLTAATARGARRGSWVPHMRLTGDIGNLCVGDGHPLPRKIGVSQPQFRRKMLILSR